MAVDGCAINVEVLAIKVDSVAANLPGSHVMAKNPMPKYHPRFRIVKISRLVFADVRAGVLGTSVVNLQG